MRISELIRQLQNELDQVGDADVSFFDEDDYEHPIHHIDYHRGIVRIDER